MVCHSGYESEKQDLEQEKLALERRLVEEYGVVIGGRTLLKALGIGSNATLQRQIAQGVIDCRLFSIPGRRGRFALAADIASWLITLRSHGANKPCR